MHLAVYALIFIATVYVMMRHGIGHAFAFCLLPAVLLVNFAKSVSMPLLPNLTSLSMVLYGVMVGLIFRFGEIKKIRWNLIDTFMVLILVPIFITTLTNGGQPLTPGGPPQAASLKLAQRAAMEFGVTWLFPYFMARIALQDAGARKLTLRVLCVLAIGIGLLTAIESSGFRPNITARVLGEMQLNSTSVAGANSMVFKRFGLARAIATAGQQIDLGNVGVLVGTMILVMIPAAGGKWLSPLSVGGILGAGAMVVGSVSMTSWAAMVVAFVCFFLFTRPGYGKYFIIPVFLAQLAFMLWQSNSMLNENNPVERPGTDVGDSRWIRVKIMQDAWPMASDAGAIGYGFGVDASKIGVGSVDNSYLLFVLQIGWVGLGLWVALLAVVVVKGTQAMARVSAPTERLPLAAMLAGVLAIVFAMYTVYFGFVYAILFAALLGMLSSMCQLLARPRLSAVTMQGGYAPHGYAMPAGGMR